MTFNRTFFSTQNIVNILINYRKRTYKAKQIIIHPGDHSSSIFYIISGSVAVIAQDSDGKEITLAYLNPGDFVGEMGLLGKNPRSARVRAKTTCELVEISYQKFFALCIKHPELIFALARQMSMRLAHTSRKACDLAFLSVRGRVTSTLVDLCNEPDALKKKTSTHIKITRQEIAKLAGCSREMVGKILKDLEAQKLVRLSGKIIMISANNHKRLSAIPDFQALFSKRNL